MCIFCCVAEDDDDDDDEEEEEEQEDKAELDEPSDKKLRLQSNPHLL